MKQLVFSNTSQQAVYSLAVAKYFEELDKGWDVVTPPIEQAPLITSRDALLNQVNWAINYLLTDSQLDEVIKSAKEKKATPIVIVVVDTAPYFDHPDLQAHARNDLAKDFVVPNRTVKRDVNGHGSHCAGVIAAKSSIHKISVIEKLLDAGLIKIVASGGLNDEGSGSYTWIANAIEHALEVQKKLPGWRVIVSMSLGGSQDSDIVKQAIDKVIKAGIFVSASAGNSYGDGSVSTMGFPGRYAPVQAIGAIDQNGQRASFSSVGNTTTDRVWVGAPGVNIFSTYSNRQYASLNGTSMANPVSVALDAALLLMYPEIKNQATLKDFKAKFATDLMGKGYDVFTGFGAPKLDKYIGQTPGDKPQDPNPDPPKVPEYRTEREVIVPIEQQFQAIWKAQNQGKFSFLKLNLEVAYTSKLRSEMIDKTITDLTVGFFTNRYFLIPNGDDFYEAMYYVRLFLEMILGSAGHKINVVKMVGTDDQGNTLTLLGDARRTIVKNINKAKTLTW